MDANASVKVMTRDLAGRRAIVTGVGRGIGRAIGMRLSSNGVRI